MLIEQYNIFGVECGGSVCGDCEGEVVGGSVFEEGVMSG